MKNEIFKIILFNVFFNLPFTINAQGLKDNNCKWLRKAIKMELFDKQFFLKKYQDEKLIIVDTSALFLICNQCKVYKREIVILRDWNTKNEMLGNNPKYKQYILVSMIGQNKNFITINFWRPYNGATVTIEIGKKKINVKSFGAF